MEFSQSPLIQPTLALIKGILDFWSPHCVGRTNSQFYDHCYRMNRSAGFVETHAGIGLLYYHPLQHIFHSVCAPCFFFRGGIVGSRTNYH